MFEYQYRRPEPISSRGLAASAFAASLERQGQRLGLRGASVSKQDQRRQIAESVKELFPEIPQDDLQAVITRAFEEVSTRIGQEH